MLGNMHTERTQRFIVMILYKHILNYNASKVKTIFETRNGMIVFQIVLSLV